MSVRVNEDNLARPQNEKGKARMRMNGRKRKAENYVNERKTLSRLEVDLVVNAEDALTKKISFIPDSASSRFSRYTSGSTANFHCEKFSRTKACLIRNWIMLNIRLALQIVQAASTQQQTANSFGIKIKVFLLRPKNFFLVSGMRWGVGSGGETRKTE